jgi:hypothetical protein
MEWQYIIAVKGFITLVPWWQNYFRFRLESSMTKDAESSPTDPSCSFPLHLVTIFQNFVFFIKDSGCLWKLFSAHSHICGKGQGITVELGTT